MKPSVEKWFLGLCSGVVTGSATSFLSALGITGANSVGITIPQLSLRQIGVLTLIGGLVGAAAYLKQSPLPPDDPEPPPPPQVPTMRPPMILLPFLCLLSLLMGGCVTPTPPVIQQAESAVVASDAKMAEADQWVQNNSGLIENGTSVLCMGLIYGTRDGTTKTHIIQCVQAVASNLQSLIKAGTVDPDSVNKAFRTNDPAIDNVLAGAASLYETNYWQGMKSGYKDFGTDLLKALSAGIMDALPATK